MSNDTAHPYDPEQFGWLIREARGEAIGSAGIPETLCEPVLSRPDICELVSLVGTVLSDGAGPSGRDLLDALDGVGYQLSPGTMYPVLHDLEREGLLEQTEYRYSKRYQVDDADAVAERLAQYECRLRWLADAAAKARTELDS